MKKRYKSTIYFLISIVLLWHLWHFPTMKTRFKNSRRFNLATYKSHIRILKYRIQIYYSDEREMPKILEDTLWPEDKDKIMLYCFNSTMAIKFNPVFPLFPFVLKRNKEKFKYSYYFDKTKDAYIVTLESPFENKPEFESLTFEIPKGYVYEY